MFRNYFKTAIRNLLKNKVHTIVNVTGLLIGFAAFLLIFLVIRYENSFDNFHAKKDRIYRVVRQGITDKDDFGAGIPYPVITSLNEEYAQIEGSARILADHEVQISVPVPGGEPSIKFKEQDGVFYAEPDFFKLFDFKFTGGAASSLASPNTALITKDFAKKYFGSETQVIGKVLKVDGNDLKITGTLENPPSNTDFNFGLVVSMPTLKMAKDNWINITDQLNCYLLMKDEQGVKQLAAAMPAFAKKHLPPTHNSYSFLLQPLKEVRTDNRLSNYSGHVFSEELMTAFKLIGVFLILMACVNFINLSTANAVNRSREVGIRKVLGSRKKELIVQFFSETAATSILAMIGAVAVAAVVLGFLNNLLEINIPTAALWSGDNMIFMTATLLIVTLLAGFYPALILAGFNPIQALTNKIKSESGGGLTLRRGLVIFQFVIAQIMIIGTLIVVSQINYFNNADLGFNKEAIINAGFPGDSASRSKADLLKSQVMALPGVKQFSLSYFPISAQGGWATDLLVSGNTTGKADAIVQMKPADTAYFSVHDLSLVAGRRFFASDTVREFMVNEALVNELKTTPDKAVGMIVKVGGVNAPIVGVVKDFHLKSLRERIEPVVMTTSKRQYRTTNIRIEPHKTKEVIAAMTKIWNQHFPSYVFEYNFLDQTIADYYRHEEQLSKLYKIFAGIAIFISCLGLYGLMNFMTVRKRKEIGIRKVLGANVSGIVVNLSKELTLLIVIAFIIAAPIAWYFMSEWLQEYSYRIPMSLVYIIVPFIISIIIAWATISHSAIKAALANPVKSLKS